MSWPVGCDLELLDRWRQGDAAAGQALFARYFDSVYRFFDTKSSGDIDDLVQQTFLACVRARDRFRGDASFRSFLFTIARYELYHHYRRRRRAGDQLDPLLSSVAELVTTPRARLARDQAHRQLLEAMTRLPVDTQMLLELHYREDLDIAELARVFEAPAATIRTRLHRGRRALRDLLAGSAVPDHGRGDLAHAG
jgi:RNA polymerase sigma-70 factor (ECF subfamily)